MFTFACLIPVKKVLGDNTPSASLKDGKNSAALQKQPVLDMTEKSRTPVQILLVEDDPIAALGAQALLEDLGCQADIAETGKTALEKCASKKYALVLMDIGLPDVSGDEVSRRIRLNDPHTPIVVLSAHIGKAAKTVFKKAGINRCLEKPLSLETAQALLAEFVLPPQEINTEKDK